MGFITANLMGGLGNQMFQIANAMAFAHRLDIEAQFVLDSFTPMQGYKPNAYIDNLFRKVKFVDNRIDVFTNINERELDFIDLGAVKEMLTKGPVSFSGYFQSIEYFEDILHKIFGMFYIDSLKFAPIQNRFINKKESTISVHVRRGDYLGISNILPTIDKSYIDKALEIHGPYDKLLIFSDDKDFAKSLNYKNSLVVEGLKDFEEMWLMSLCNHHIISNSSFSWWGSFLNHIFNPNGKVYAPSVWLGPSAEPFVKDIYRKNMIKVNVEYKNGVLYA